jgi:sarcosine oxidase, subunit gamma
MLESSQVRIMTLATGASLCLKSWRQASMNNGRISVLGGRELPSQVGVTLSGPMRILCVGPEEWLVLSREKSASSVREYVEPDLSRQDMVLVDLTDGVVVLEARGSAIREVLSKGCGLDFHPRSFPPGRCARTRFAKIPVVIDCLDEPLGFELTVSRSYLQYLNSWLIDAAVEFG